MSANLTIRQARLVLPDRVVTGDLVVEDGVIAAIGPSVESASGEQVDGRGLTVLPGVIDPQVHFREPSDNPTETLASGSRAAAAGGVTAFLDMPNNDPACTTIERLEAKLAAAAEHSVVHYGMFIGATAGNLDVCNAAERAAGVMLFLGNSTGDLLVDDPDVIESFFAHCTRRLAVHAEDEARIRARMEQYADSHDVADHARIRDAETSILATQRVIELAHKHGRRLHLQNLSTADEVTLVANADRDLVTAEVTANHLFLHAEDAYARLGTKAQCNPPIRRQRHADALFQGLLDGTLDCLASDHAPHPMTAKNLPYPASPSGIPGVEWTLPLLLDAAHQGRCTLRQVARWTSEAPARCFGIPRKGRLEVGYDADLVLVDTAASREVTDASTRSGCGWSPWTGRTLTGWPVLTVVLGRPVFRDGAIVDGVRGRALTTTT